MRKAVIVSGARTPFGKLGGALKAFKHLTWRKSDFGSGEAGRN